MRYLRIKLGLFLASLAHKVYPTWQQGDPLPWDEPRCGAYVEHFPPGCGLPPKHKGEHGPEEGMDRNQTPWAQMPHFLPDGDCGCRGMTHQHDCKHHVVPF